MQVLTATCFTLATLALAYVLLDRGARRRSKRYAAIAARMDREGVRWRYWVLVAGLVGGAGALARLLWRWP